MSDRRIWRYGLRCSTWNIDVILKCKWSPGVPGGRGRGFALAVEMQKGDYGQNDCAEEDLSYVIVENLLIHGRRIEGLRFFLGRCFPMDGVGCGGCVLFCVHVMTPVAKTQNFSWVLRKLPGEFPYF